MKMKHSPGPWKVNPQYGMENVYWLWDKNSMYHDDLSPERMDRNAQLMQAAPDMLKALQMIHACIIPDSNGETWCLEGNVTESVKAIMDSIAKARGI